LLLLARILASQDCYRSTLHPLVRLQATIANQLRQLQKLFSTSVEELVQDSTEVQKILARIESELPETILHPLWQAGHLPFFKTEVATARRRIEARRSQPSVKADIREKCQLINAKKAALDAKTKSSTSTERLASLKKEREELQKRLRENEQLIHDEEVSIANSKQEVDSLTNQLKAELSELHTLRQRIVTGEDKDDEAVIAKADRIRAEAIHAIEKFLQ
jgi:hypothetical protein